MPPRKRDAPRSSASAPGERRQASRAAVRFGGRLRARRVAAALTQAEVAERAGLDVSYVSQIERGLRDPSLSSIESLARAFGLSLADLFADDEQAGGLHPAVRSLALELSRLDEAALRDVTGIVRRLRSAIERAARRRG